MPAESESNVLRKSIERCPTHLRYCCRIPAPNHPEKIFSSPRQSDLWTMTERPDPTESPGAESKSIEWHCSHSSGSALSSCCGSTVPAWCKYVPSEGARVSPRANRKSAQSKMDSESSAFLSRLGYASSVYEGKVKRSSSFLGSDGHTSRSQRQHSPNDDNSVLSPTEAGRWSSFRGNSR